MENNNPEPSTEQETRSIFSEHDFSIEGYNKNIRQARNTIFVAAGLILVSLIMLLATLPEDYEYMWIDITIWSVFIIGFVLLGLWTKKKPYTAIVSALILYILVVVLNAALDITTLYKGILVKIVIIGLLVKSINNAKEAQQMKDQFARR